MSSCVSLYNPGVRAAEPQFTNNAKRLREIKFTADCSRGKEVVEPTGTLAAHKATEASTPGPGVLLFPRGPYLCDRCPSKTTSRTQTRTPRLLKPQVMSAAFKTELGSAGADRGCTRSQETWR